MEQLWTRGVQWRRFQPGAEHPRRQSPPPHHKGRIAVERAWCGPTCSPGDDPLRVEVCEEQTVDQRGLPQARLP